MRLTVFSDLQAEEGVARCFHNPALPLQRWRVERFFDFLYQLHTEQGCSGLVDLGDTFDHRSAIAVPTIDVVKRGVMRFSAQNLYRVNGNHDQWSKSAEIHNGSLFEPDFHVIPGPELESIELRNGTVLVFCAYPADEEKLCADLQRMGQRLAQRRTILFGHFTVKGCSMASGPSATGVPKRLLEPFTLALLGHVHRPQEIYPHVHYIGSPFQQDFGEANEIKRVAIVDTASARVNWVPTTGFPLYRVVSMHEFTREAREDSEDRFRVRLENAGEAERFYKHPLCARAEPLYLYEQAGEGTGDGEVVVEQDWSLEAAVRRWVDTAPPKERGIPLETQEMVEFGLSIAKRGEP